MSKSTFHLVIEDGPKKGETLDRKPGALIRIGRIVRGNTVAVKDPSISQKHLTVEFDTQICRWTVTDLDTPNGTFVNGVRIPSSVAFPLSDGDSVKIGESTAISIKIVDAADGEGSKRVVAKRGRKGASVRVSLAEDGIEPPKRGRAGSAMVSEKDGVVDLEDGLGRARRRTSSRVLKKDEILDPVCVEGGTDLPVKLRRGRKGDSSKGLKAQDVFGDALVDNSDGPENMEERSLKEECQVLDSVVRDEIEVQKLGRGLNFSSVLKEDETLDPVIVEDRTRVPKNLPRGRRGAPSRASKADESAGTVVADGVEVPPRTLKGMKNFSSVLKEDETLDPALMEDRTRAPKNLPRGRKGASSRASKADESAGGDSIEVPPTMLKGTRNFSSILKEDDTLDPAFTEDRTRIPKNLPRGRRGASSIASKADESAGADSIEVPPKGRKVYSRVSKINDIKGGVVADNIDVQESLLKGRRRNSKTDETKDAVVADSSEAPKSLRIGGKGIPGHLSKKGDALCPVVEDNTDVPSSFGRGRKSTRSQVLKKDEALDSIVEENNEEDPPKLRRGRSSPNAGLKKEESLNLVPEGSNQVPKNVGGKRKNVSRKVLKDAEALDSVVKEGFEAPEDLKRGSRINLSQVSDSVAEDIAEEPVKLGKGKRRAYSTRVRNNVEVLASAVEESIQVPDVGKGRLRKAPARRTRAVSARISKKEQESAPLDSPLNPVENIFHPKELRGDQLGPSKKIQSPNEKKDNKSQTREAFDKENKGSTQIPNEEGPDSTNVAEPSRVLLKTWNGNGIPNTTSKYKEEAKVSWHATPFEERLEKALSGDKLLPQRS